MIFEESDVVCGGIGVAGFQSVGMFVINSVGRTLVGLGGREGFTTYVGMPVGIIVSVFSGKKVIQFVGKGGLVIIGVFVGCLVGVIFDGDGVSVEPDMEFRLHVGDGVFVLPIIFITDVFVNIDDGDFLVLDFISLSVFIVIALITPFSCVIPHTCMTFPTSGIPMILVSGLIDT